VLCNLAVYFLPNIFVHVEREQASTCKISPITMIWHLNILFTYIYIYPDIRYVIQYIYRPAQTADPAAAKFVSPAGSPADWDWVGSAHLNLGMLPSLGRPYLATPPLALLSLARAPAPRLPLPEPTLPFLAPPSWPPLALLSLAFLSLFSL